MKKPLVIVDVGCRWGFADRFLKNINDVTLYGFEPDKEECKRLESLYPMENVYLIPLGLAERSGEYTLYQTREPACSSMYKPNQYLTDNYPTLDCATLINKTLLNAVSLYSWSKDNSVTYVDYIKLDTQGSELDILRGADSLLETVRVIEVEVSFNPIYEGAATFSDIDQFLRNCDFVLWNISTLAHYSSRSSKAAALGALHIAYDDYAERIQSKGGQLFWGDACYIKKDMLDIHESSSRSNQVSRDAKLLEILELTDVLAEVEPHVTR